MTAEVDGVAGDSGIFASLFTKDVSSRIGIGFVAGIMNNSFTIKEVIRNQAVVSRLPKGPLFMFVVSLLLYAVFALVIVILNCFSRRECSIIPSDLKVVQKILSDPGALVHEVFGEDKNVEVVSARKIFLDQGDGTLRVL